MAFEGGGSITQITGFFDMTSRVVHCPDITINNTTAASSDNESSNASSTSNIKMANVLLLKTHSLPSETLSYIFQYA
jgi:hypothetical protein